jgi:alanine racemase
LAAALALGPAFVPVLNTPAQVALWRQTGRACDLMVDTGITRLGLDMADLAMAEGLSIDTLHSHLACADTPVHPLNLTQLARFREVCAHVQARRRALANSAGILLGADFHFDLTRPGLALYGGTAGSAAVVRLEAPVLQLREVPAGTPIGYGATHVTAAPARIATVALGYADGYPRALAGWGHALAAGVRCPVVGRVSMDLITLDVTAAAGLAEGDNVVLPLDLPAAARASARSEYELLTGLGARYARIWS